MKCKYVRLGFSKFISALLLVFYPSLLWAEPVRSVDKVEIKNIWAHDNLVAWEVAPYDTMKRSSEERAKMLKRLGLKHYAYLSSSYELDTKEDVTISQHNVDAEIEAMQNHGINIKAWYFWFNADDPAEVPKIRATFESFQRHNIRPQIWVTHSYAYWPQTPEEWAELLPEGVSWPDTMEAQHNISPEQWPALKKAYEYVEANNTPKTPAEREQRIKQEAERIYKLVKLASQYGCKVNIYSHRGWFGVIDNQLAILERLKEMGVTDVGMVYNFSHSRSQFHDDTKTFPQLWEKMKPYVVAVNVVGLSGEGEFGGGGYPSQGDYELDMMRTIQNSGWSGAIGVLGAVQMDTEVVLKKAMRGMDWIAAELKQPGSGGLRPVFFEPEK